MSGYSTDVAPEMESGSVHENIEAKIVILGEQNVGKTSFVVVFDPNAENGDTDKLKKMGSTIGASFVTCCVRVQDKFVRMQIWDTAGQERFRAMAPMYYRKANAAVVMYDVSCTNSFLAAKLWINELKRNIETPVLILLVGNKADLSDQRVISHEQGHAYATSVGALFCETSAITAKGVAQAFTLLARNLVEYEQRYTNLQYKFSTDDYVQLQKSHPAQPDDARRSSCC